MHCAPVLGMARHADVCQAGACMAGVPWRPPVGTLLSVAKYQTVLHSRCYSRSLKALPCRLMIVAICSGSSHVHDMVDNGHHGMQIWQTL